VNTNAKGNGWTVLHFAAFTGKQHIIPILSKHVDINKGFGANNLTATHLAAKSNNSDIIKVLIENGADPSIQDHLGRTPILLAAQSKRRDAVKSLVRYGGPNQADIRDVFGRNTFDIATSRMKQFLEKSCHHSYRRPLWEKYPYFDRRKKTKDGVTRWMQEDFVVALNQDLQKDWNNISDYNEMETVYCPKKTLHTLSNFLNKESQILHKVPPKVQPKQSWTTWD